MIFEVMLMMRMVILMLIKVMKMKIITRMIR